jgi:tetratricopeptide (TPR) repeat protein
LLSVIASEAEDVEALFQLARVYDRRAVQLFQSIATRDPDSPFVYMLQAERLASENDLPRAKAEYQRALDLRPDLAGILERLEAVPASSGAQSVQSPSTFAGIRSSFTAGRFQEAAAAAKRLLAVQPEDAEATYWLGRAYQALAAATVDRLTEVAPESYRVEQLAGELHADRTEYANAIAAYQRALRKAPDVPGLRYAVATSYWKMGNFADALRWIEEELDRNPHHALARYRLGNLLVDQGRPADAIPHLLQALSATPDHAEARFDLGRAYLEGQQHAEAARELEAYARINPDNDRVHYLLGNAYRGLGRLEDARRAFQTYQELSRRRLEKVQQDVKSVAEDVERAAP